MSKVERDGDTTRRGFMKLASISAPAAVAAVAIGSPAKAAEEPKTELGYRKTEHVKAYLDSCRF